MSIRRDIYLYIYAQLRALDDGDKFAHVNKLDLADRLEYRDLFVDIVCDVMKQYSVQHSIAVSVLGSVISNVRKNKEQSPALRKQGIV